MSTGKTKNVRLNVYDPLCRKPCASCSIPRLAAQQVFQGDSSLSEISPERIEDHECSSTAQRVLAGFDLPDVDEGKSTLRSEPTQRHSEVCPETTQHFIWTLIVHGKWILNIQTRNRQGKLRGIFTPCYSRSVGLG